jgi:AraC family transcriptional regulator
MLEANTRNSVIAVAPFVLRSYPRYPSGIIADEPQWRTPGSGAPSTGTPRVLATRWRSFEQTTHEAAAVTPNDCHVIGIAMRSMDVRLSIAGRTVLDGGAMPGTPLIAGPGEPIRCLFRGPCDELHLYAPNDLIAECAHDLPGHEPAQLGCRLAPVRDPVVERLAWTLLGADDIRGATGQLYVDCICLAIIARLLSATGRSASGGTLKSSALPRWRLKRAIDHVDAHLDEAVTLRDLAKAAGLTRMHFAAQFRAATGLRPHEYLLRRRIERAQQILAGTDLPIVEVALGVGFQTQAHFTTVFKRFAGQPPRAWRQSQPVCEARRSAPSLGWDRPSQPPRAV